MQAQEGRQIFSAMSVKEKLILGGGPHGMDGFERLGLLFPVLGYRMGQLARALMRRPKMLLPDKPSLGLAPRRVKAISDLVKGVREQGVSILIVEQNVRAALKAADPRGAEAYFGGRVLDGHGLDSHVTAPKEGNSP